MGLYGGMALSHNLTRKSAHIRVCHQTINLPHGTFIETIWKDDKPIERLSIDLNLNGHASGAVKVTGEG